MKEFSRWAGDLGFEYQVIEGFWSLWSDAQIKELVDCLRERGVGLFFWKRSRDRATTRQCILARAAATGPGHTQSPRRRLWIAFADAGRISLNLRQSKQSNYSTHV